MKLSGLQKAIRAKGSVADFARAVGVSYKVVVDWLKAEGCDVPEEVKMADSGIRRAINKAGGHTALAKHLGVTCTAVQNWVKLGWVPPARAQEIENSYGVPRAELVSPKVRNALGLGGEL